MARRKKKRTISPEQLEKMREGRERKKKQQERVEMLSELDERLARGRREANDKPIKIKSSRRKHYHK